MTHIWASLVIGEELRAKKQVGAKKKNAASDKIGFLTAAS
jgi:hypothetical protein